ncbi:MAG: hypothetical protein A2020_05945 [Lentisphaerae bacterium GWF2_45_14]|nr:MAG: hypothetical protein A2020_05945 [Lentisphaerae bacterium GWF2_45_14]
MFGMSVKKKRSALPIMAEFKIIEGTLRYRQIISACFDTVRNLRIFLRQSSRFFSADIYIQAVTVINVVKSVWIFIERRSKRKQYAIKEQSPEPCLFLQPLALSRYSACRMGVRSMKPCINF